LVDESIDSTDRMDKNKTYVRRAVDRSIDAVADGREEG
jgi:hypothetical protein